MRTARNPFQRWSHQRAAKERRAAEKRITPGDGRSLTPFRWWQQITRAVFYLPLDVETGQRVVYAIDFRHWHQLFSYDGKGKAALYADGVQLAESRLPAAFPIPGGAIEVEPAAFGLRRCHWVTDEGREYQLIPDERSAEARRARMKLQHPRVSRLIGAGSLVFIVVPLALLIIQLTEVLLSLPPVTATLGAFSPLLHLPLWLNLILGFVVAFAATERALRFRHNWAV
jgi:catechol 2,3-dioxygenase-like lactoylglutathione lyase family enzyme